MTREFVVAREVAEEELAKFQELNDLDIDGAIKEAKEEAEEEEDEEDSDDEDDDAKASDGGKGLRKAKETLIRAIMLGRLAVENDGALTYTPQFPYKSDDHRKPLTFSEPDGGGIATVKKRKTPSSGDMVPLMASMTGAIPVRFNKMKQRDLKVCWAITNVFLGAGA